MSSALYPFHQFAFLAYCQMSSTALLVYDCVNTLDAEVEHIWRGEFSGAKVLYLFNRYTYLGEVLFDLMLTLGPQGVTGCKVLNVCLGATKFAANICTALISAFRVWAIWGQRWTLFLVVLPIALIVPCFNVANFASARTNQVNGLQVPFGGCVWMSVLSMETTQRLQVITRVSAIITDLIVLCSTWLKTHKIRRKMQFNKVKAPLLALLFRDGSMYFGALLFLNILALVAEYLVNTLENPVPYFIDVLTCILISRFMLNLRSFKVAENSKISSASAGYYPTSNSGGVLSTIVGNFGAPLSMGSLDDEDGLSLEVSSSDLHDDPLAAGLIIEEHYDPNYIEVLDIDAEHTPLFFARV